MSLLHSIGLLLTGRGTVITTQPVTVGDERLGIEMVFNRITGESRVLSNMSLDMARDISADLGQLQQPRTGTHAYTAALGYLLSAGQVPQ